MKRENWQKVKAIFDLAVEIAPDARSSFLNNACTNDGELRRKVETLLASSDEAESFMETPFAGEIAELILDTPANQLKNGQIFNHYKIVQKIGAGGMGEVYLAQDATLERTVALKVLPTELASDRQRMQRFKQEARTASALNHPNVASIYEIGEENGMHFIAMEFVDGSTLRQQMENARLMINQVIDIAIQIADALSAAHEAGVVHRDIKPENIMVRGRDGYVKVLDFGIAKLIERQATTIDKEALTEMFQTEAGAIIGTVNYMSPEQARGLAVDERTDIWSFGVLLYEMIAAKRPFAGVTMVDSLVSIIEREPVPLKQHCPEIPAELAHTVAGALVKNRDARHQSFQVILSELRALKKQLEFESAKLSSLPTVFEKPTILKNFERDGVEEARQFESSSSQPSRRASTQNRRQRTRKSINSIAVLPLVNESADPDLDYLSDGITESLIDSLSPLPRLRVMARTTVFRYKGRDISPQEVGSELDVQAVVVGRIRQFKDTLAIRIELVDTVSGEQLWGEQYRKKFEDIFTVQEESAREISEKLQLRLNSQEKKRLTKRHTDSVEAYQFYLKGRYFWNKRTADWMKKGTAYFQQAMDSDPNYALAYAGLADSYISFATVCALSPQEACPKAKASAIRALEIDSELAESHATLAHIKNNYDWDWRGSEKSFKRAIKLNPNYSIAYHWYGICLLTTRRFDESIAAMKVALRLDPLSLIINTVMGLPYYFLRQYDEAIELYQKTLEMDPTFFPAHGYLGLAYGQKMMYEEAISEFHKALSFSKDNTLTLASLGHAYAVSGEKDKAEQMLARLNELSKQKYVSAYVIAEIYAGLEDKEQALFWLEKAYRERSWWLIYIAINPRFDNLRSDSRFTNLVQRVGVPL